MADALEVNYQYHVVELRKAWYELDVDLGLLAPLETTAIVLDVELGLEAPSISWYSDHVVDVDLRGVREVNSLLNRELVGDSTKVYDLLGELEGRSHNVALEGESKHFRASLQGESESLGELAENVTLESDLDQVADVLVDAEDSLSLAEVELGSERRLVRDELPMAVNLTCVLNADSKLYKMNQLNTKTYLFLEVHEDVPDVLLWERKLGLWTLALASHVEGEPLLRARGVAEGRARVVVRPLRLEGHAARDLRVWPNLALEWLYCEDLVLEEHGIVIDGLSDALVLARESGNRFLTGPGPLELELCLVIGVIAVQALITALVVILSLENGSLFVLLLSELLVQAGFLLVFLLLGSEGSPRELDRYLALVHDCVILVRVQSNACGIHVNVGL